MRRGGLYLASVRLADDGSSTARRNEVQAVGDGAMTASLRRFESRTRMPVPVQATSTQLSVCTDLLLLRHAHARA
ncbi:hypothetical protein H114_00317 [Streptomyces gancidicus BKS 13-15]|uniref:Uncharacterized protein n=1 Tax=Streptomyces gancidicus BKS 13-15 TaxID=1284664 RepID=M3ED61_STREZ|nr:hypothetical protein H114_00317 [Streptomyces gancidicus BKS 13-15]